MEVKKERIEKLIFTRNYLTEQINKEWSEQIKNNSTIYLGKRKRQLELITTLDKEIKKLEDEI